MHDVVVNLTVWLFYGWVVLFLLTVVIGTVSSIRAKSRADREQEVVDAMKDAS